MFYSELAGGLQKKLPKATNKFTSQTIKNCCTKTSCNVSNDFELSNASEEVIKKILHVPAKVLRDGAEVFALSLRNIINLSIKSSTFPEECKIAKLTPIFKKGARTAPKNCRPISFLLLYQR